MSAATNGPGKLRAGAAAAAAVAAVAFCVAACTSHTSDGGSPAPPSTSAPSTSLSLVNDSFMGVRFLRPADWKAPVAAHSSTGSGNITYTAPGHRGTLYVERNDCAACVDKGLVTRGHRNGQPDADNALSSYFPLTERHIDAYDVTFTVATTNPYVSTGKLVVTRAHGELTGYVVAIVTLPASDAATTDRVLASLRSGQ